MRRVDPRPLLGEPLPLDLLNTHWIERGELQDLLETVDGVAIWLASSSIPAAERPAAGEDLRLRLSETREAIQAVAEHPASVDARSAFNAILARGHRRRRLAEAPQPGAGGRSLSTVVAEPGWEVPWTVADTYLDLLDRSADRIRRCQHPECVLWYLDTSKSGNRRWCSMSICGNRAKAARHYRRQTD